VIGLDTNLLVRLLVRDDPAQAQRARAFVEAHSSPEDPAWVSQVVLCELVWVLTAGYGYRRAEVADVLQALLSTGSLLVEEASLVSRAVAEYRRGAADFADCLLARLNRARGCSTTGTFDRKAARLEGFTLV
jgi:predicted nucleic-acid-binding protein